MSTAQDGPVRRFVVEDRNLLLAADVAVRSRRPIAVATGRGPADVLLVAVDERVEVWTAPLAGPARSSAMTSSPRRRAPGDCSRRGREVTS